MKDYYQILGVSKEASSDEIRKAYHKLAHKYHPDKGGDEKKFKEINEAYQILSNKEKRGQYDKFGRVFEGKMPGQEGGFTGNWDFGSFWQDFGRSREFDFDAEDLGSLFEDFFGFGAAKSPRKKRNRGRDIEFDIEINLEDSLTGKTKEITFQKYVACSRCEGRGAEPGSKIKECFSCRGSGEVQQIKRTVFGQITRYVVCPECKGYGQTPEKPCNVCTGEGRIKKEEEVKVVIPPGIDSGQIIKIKGKGEAGKRGAEAGDLYARVFVKAHPVFQRKGDNLYITLPISFSQAALGDEIEVPTLEGKKILLKVPSGAETGKTLKISGKGIPSFSGFSRGNLYVELVIETPKKITKKQKELLEQLKKEGI